MTEDEDIETVFSRFQVLVSGLQVMNKSYTNYDNVKKIFRSIPIKYRPKVSAIQEANNLNIISLESLIRNIQSHVMELNGDEPAKISKYLALKYVVQPAKSSKVWKFEEVVYVGVFEEDSNDEETVFIIKRF